MKLKSLLLLPALAFVLQAQEAKPHANDATPTLKPEPVASDPFVEGSLGGRGLSTTSRLPDNRNSPPYSLCAEYFSLPLADAATLRRENLSDTELYERILRKLKEETCKQEDFVILRGRFGEVASSESLVEETYPTEYSPPKISESKTLIPPHGSAFETRNTGQTTEVIAKLNPDQTVSLRYSPEFVYMIEPSTWGQGTFQVTMPTVESQRFNLGLKLQLGKAALAGTINRPPQSTSAPNNVPQIWLAFVTIDLIKE